MQVKRLLYQEALSDCCRPSPSPACLNYCSFRSPMPVPPGFSAQSWLSAAVPDELLTVLLLESAASQFGCELYGHPGHSPHALARSLSQDVLAASPGPGSVLGSGLGDYWDESPGKHSSPDMVTLDGLKLGWGTAQEGPVGGGIIPSLPAGPTCFQLHTPPTSNLLPHHVPPTREWSQLHPHQRCGLSKSLSPV